MDASKMTVASVAQVEAGHDVEAQEPSRTAHRVSHWQLIFNPAGVNEKVLQHKYRGRGTHASPYIVDFLPQDGHNPMQFSMLRKWCIGSLQGLATLVVAFVSTAYSGGMTEIAEDFNVSSEIAILGVSLFVLGFAIGPLLFAPAGGKFQHSHPPFSLGTPIR